MKKPAASSEHKTETVQALSSSLTASLTAPPPEMMLMFPQEFHQQTAALRDLSFGLGAGMMPMFDSGMFIPPPPGFAASSPVVAKTRGRGRRGRGRLRGRGVMAAEGVEKGVAMGGVRRGGRGRGGRGSRSRAAEMMKTLTEKYLQVCDVCCREWLCECTSDLLSLTFMMWGYSIWWRSLALPHLTQNLPFSCILRFIFVPEFSDLFLFQNFVSI